MTSRTLSETNIDTLALALLSLPPDWREDELTKLETIFADGFMQVYPELPKTRHTESATKMIGQVRDRLAQIAASGGAVNDNLGKFPS